MPPNRQGTARFPDLVIAGAPKCGTTSFYDWLTDHPEVAGAGKDSYFLADPGVVLGDETRRIHQFGLSEYRQVHHPDARVVVEGGAAYLYQRTARETLSSLVDPPRIVVIVRDPAERLYSVYRYFSNNKSALSSAMSFSDYVEALRAGRSIGVVDQTATDALEHGKYVDFLLRWREAFPRGKIVVIPFDTVIVDPALAIRKALRPFQVDQAFWASYEAPNTQPTRSVRNRGAHRALRQLLATRIPRRSLLRLKSLYWKLNASPNAEVPRRDLDVIADLRAYYRPHNLRLTDEFGVPTDPWLP